MLTKHLLFVRAHGWVSENFLSALQEAGAVLNICSTHIIFLTFWI